MESKRLQHSPKPRVNRREVPDDTAIRSLSYAERERISMDAWEPTLLRKLLKAQDRLKRQSRKPD